MNLVVLWFYDVWLELHTLQHALSVRNWSTRTNAVQQTATDAVSFYHSTLSIFHLM